MSGVPFLIPPWSGLERWVNRWWPSRRLGSDPLEQLRVDGRYVPVSIANWKLTPAMRRLVLARRVVHELTFAADQKLTVLIPYRGRDAHLRELLPRLLAALQAQQIEHHVLVVEQEQGKQFNRGRLLNIGMQYAAQSTDYYCIHDVDAIPVVADYRSPSQPLRLVNKILVEHGSSHRDRHYFSGAVTIRKEQAFAVNGFSNGYWGWGKEDDDFFFRLIVAGYLCYFDTEGVFHDLPNPKHEIGRRDAGGVPVHVKRNRAHRSQLVRGLLDPLSDGLTTLRYSSLESERHESYEKIRVRF